MSQITVTWSKMETTKKILNKLENAKNGSHSEPSEEAIPQSLQKIQLVPGGCSVYRDDRWESRFPDVCRYEKKGGTSR